MKSLSFAILVVTVSVSWAKPEQYSDRYDNVNLDEILSNHRLLTPYVKCMLDQGKCSPDARQLKSQLREAIQNNCAKCTDFQRVSSRKVIRHLINHEPEYWSQLIAKYDPTHMYSKKYESEFNQANNRH